MIIFLNERCTPRVEAVTESRAYDLPFSRQLQPDNLSQICMSVSMVILDRFDTVLDAGRENYYDAPTHTKQM